MSDIKEASVCPACDQFVDIADPMLRTFWKIKELKTNSEYLSTIDRAKLYKEHVNFICDAFCELYKYNEQISKIRIEKIHDNFAIQEIVSVLEKYNFLPGPPRA